MSEESKIQYGAEITWNQFLEEHCDEDCWLTGERLPLSETRGKKRWVRCFLKFLNEVGGQCICWHKKAQSGDEGLGGERWRRVHDHFHDSSDLTLPMNRKHHVREKKGLCLGCSSQGGFTQKK